MNEYAEIKENVDIKDLLTFKVGPTVKYLAKVDSKDNLKKLINYLKKNKINYIILGNGSNIIMDDKYYDGMVIKLDYLNKIEFRENEVYVEAGVLLPYLVTLSLQNDYVNLIPFSMIPGSIGGSIRGNAGANGKEIFDYVKQVEVLDKKGCIKTLKKKDIKYSYRNTSLKKDYIILSCVLELEKGDTITSQREMIENNEKRKSTQPLDMPCIGSIFKNPEGNSAGRIIDELGLKGKVIGGAKVSEKHANFIVNFNSAKFSDIIELIELIKKEVKEKRGITLEVEGEVITW